MVCIGDCIFCKIVAGEAPYYKVYEDEDFLSILDIFPNIKGQSVVLSKKHLQSYAFDIDDQTLKDFIIASKKTAKILEKALGVGRVHAVIEGTGINHLHAKLYPAIGSTKGFRQHIASEKRYFESYPGYVSTLMGPEASRKELEELHKSIMKATES